MARGLTPSSALRILYLGAQVGIFTRVYKAGTRWGYEMSSPSGRRFAGRNHASWLKAEKWAAHLALLEMRRTWKKNGAQHV